PLVLLELPCQNSSSSCDDEVLDCAAGLIPTKSKNLLLSSGSVTYTRSRRSVIPTNLDIILGLIPGIGCGKFVC
ncbi:unnamed protein product, partial [Adineta ricciae]